MPFRHLAVLTGLLAASLMSPGVSAEPLDIKIGYIQWVPDQGPVLSNVIPEPEDAGLRGAELAIGDNSTTGKFLGQSYSLWSEVADSEETAVAAFGAMRQNGIELFVVNAPAQTLNTIVGKAGDNTLIFNAGASDDALRTAQCHVNLLHTIPSYAMLTDALGQWLSQRRWKEVFLITGPTGADKGWADAFRRSARRFGLEIVEDKPWTFDADLRRTASRELPLFTRGDDYDAVAQLQNRFRELAGRDMNSEDYAAWAAVRSIGTAVTDLDSANPAEIRNFLFSDNFQLAAFKGRKLTYRDWNGQLRQPIPLVHPRGLVARAPFESFLHPTTTMDTLGFDKPESECRING